MPQWTGQRASWHHIEQRRQVHSSLAAAAAVPSENDALAAGRCGSVSSARMIIVICFRHESDAGRLKVPRKNV